MEEIIVNSKYEVLGWIKDMINRLKFDEILYLEITLNLSEYEKGKISPIIISKKKKRMVLVNES